MLDVQRMACASAVSSPEMKKMSFQELALQARRSHAEDTPVQGSIAGKHTRFPLPRFEARWLTVTLIGAEHQVGTELMENLLLDLVCHSVAVPILIRRQVG